MGVNMIENILKQWNIGENIVQLQHNTWSINEDYILKEYTDLNDLKRNIEMLKSLYKLDVPVQKLIKLPDGQDYFEQNNMMYVLTTKMKGKNVTDISSCDNEWFYNFGKILARLHLAFKECEKEINCWDNSLLNEMNGWVIENLLKFSPEYLGHEDIKTSINELSKMYDELPKQLIHRDVHLGNFLFDNGLFSGYIDFDLSQSNIRIFDISYFLVGLLTREDSKKIEKEHWFEIIGQVVKGYDSLSELSKSEKESITYVMKNIELLFTAYFLGADNEKLAKSAAELFLYVKNNEKKIQEIISTL